MGKKFKNYKYFLGYLDDYEIMPLFIMLPKTKVYIKSYDGETKWMYFLLKMMNYQKNIMAFGLKSVIAFKENLNGDSFTTKNF